MMATRWRIGLVLIAAGSVMPPTRTQAADVRKSSVGMPSRIEQLVLPGGELEPRPLEDRDAPVVVRVVAVYPHGTAHRYDLEYYGLEPGRYDLRNYLRRKDASTTDDLPELPIEVVSLLPAGQIVPHALEARPAPRLGGYRAVLIFGAVLWLAALAAIALVGRRRKTQALDEAEPSLSLADRLRPLVESALAGRLSSQGQAQLERLLLTYWRRRLDLEGVAPAVAIARLREHDEAGRLLRQIEDWLHRPGGTEQVDVAAVLAPYRDLPTEESVAAGPEHPTRRHEPVGTPGGAAR